MNNSFEQIEIEFEFLILLCKSFLNLQVQWHIPFSPTRDFSESRWDSNPAPKRDEEMDVDEEEDLQSKTPVNVESKKLKTPFRIPFKQD